MEVALAKIESIEEMEVTKPDLEYATKATPVTVRMYIPVKEGTEVDTVSLDFMPSVRTGLSTTLWLSVDSFYELVQFLSERKDDLLDVRAGLR